MNENTYDVAVIGYGPVGVTAANLLGQLGLRVLVVERDADVYARARAISTDEEVLRIWQRIGLADRLSADMLPDRAISFVDAEGRTFLSFTPKTWGNGHPTQQFIYQPALEQTLRAGVDRFPNVEVLLGHECTGLDQDAEGVDLTIGRTGTDGEVRKARAAYVIAADGGSSRTRARLNVGFEGRTFKDRWVVIDTKVIKPWPEVDRLRFHCNPARPAVDCPTPLGHHRWEFPLLPGDDANALVTREGVLELLAGQGIGPEHVEVQRGVIYHHHVRFADRWRVGRVFLAGDAAHAMPPWIGQGMGSGVRDVDNLCWKLAAAVDGRQPADAVDRLLDSYETERKPHVQALTRAAVFFGRVITERRPAVTAIRDPLFRLACRFPGLGSYLRDLRWFPVTAYRSGLLATQPGRRGSRHAVGAHIPQPWVLDQAGRRARLDDAIGNTAWAVLCTAPTGGRADVERWRRAGVQVLELRAAGSDPGRGAVVDVENQLRNWMHSRGVTAMAVRPDSIVYSGAAAGGQLAAPPLSTMPPGPRIPAVVDVPDAFDRVPSVPAA